MKTKIVDMMLALPLISAAGVPAAMAAVPVPEPMPIMEDSLDMSFSKLRISPRHYDMDLMPGERDKITVTVTNKNNETVSVVPTVRRILPETSAKFYASKTCLGVTWADASVSALVDMDRRSVVKTGGG
jgi:hypothetical protein